MLKRLATMISTALLASIVGHGPAMSAEDDLAFWSLARYQHRFSDVWGAEMQAEVRFNDDISQLDEVLLKPSLRYYFLDKYSLSLGYKHVEKKLGSNEHDIWQELHLEYPSGLFGFHHQFRMEERFINGISGMIPRLTLKSNVSHPLSDDVYLAFWEAAFFNLADKGEGPVSGFEQNRVYGGIGFKLSKAVKLEFGYLWGYERKRTGPNESNHVLQFQLLINTDSRN